MPHYINGPTNFAHLSGSINGINKEIYLFFDSHLDINNQTRCESFDSIDISQYLYKLIKNSKTELDFFLEIRQSEINQPLSNKRDIYIKEVDELFKSEFIVEQINDRNKVKYSKSNPNVRLHNLDIRDHFDMFYILDIIQYDINDIFKLLATGLNIKDNIAKILKKLYNIKYYLDKLKKNKIDVIYNPKSIYDKKDKQQYYLDKVINKYEHINLKDNINLFLDEHFTYIHRELMLALDNLIENLKYYEIKHTDEKFINNIKKNLQTLYDSSVDIYSLFIDVYLLRRILDKKYITNCIVYAGSQHCTNYMYFLLKYCNFKLINIQKSIETDKNKLIDSIKNADFAFNIYKLLYLQEKKYTQCIQKYTPFPREHRGGKIDYPDFDKFFNLL
jgi:hypothetical protein